MLTDKVILIGGGGHCKSVIEAIQSRGVHTEIKITDSNKTRGELVLGCEVIGSDEALCQYYARGYKDAIVTIGSIQSTALRRNVQKNAEKIGFHFPAIMDASAVIAKSAEIKRGVFVGKNAVVNADAVVEDFAIINTGAIIEHECRIGQFSHVAIGAVVCGNVEIGEDVFIGANATIVQGVKVGMNSIIGAGSVILADVPERKKVVGIWGGYCSVRRIIEAEYAEICINSSGWRCMSC